jgi:hypothetical protein
MLYIAMLKCSFAAIGHARKCVSGDRNHEWFLWCLGSSLFANVVAQFGINYMAQLLLVLFPLLAFISVAAFEARQAKAQGPDSRDQRTLASVFDDPQRKMLVERW